MRGKLKVLLVGASGRIGKNFVEDYWKQGYNKKYELILGARHIFKLKDKRYKTFKIVEADLEDRKSLNKAFKGVDVILNLAANANQHADFLDLVKPNIIGTYNLFEEAVKNKVKRVITMSSIHAVKGYKEKKIIEGMDAPRPLNFYGATKAFVEAMSYVYYRNKDISTFVIRIGAYVSDDLIQKVCFERKNYDYVISQRDMAQLFHRSIIAPMKTKYGILSGVSNNKKKRLSLKCTEKLVGYKPKDDVYALCNACKNGKC